MKAVAGLVFLVFAGVLAAQTPSLVTSVGYTTPEPVAVAPGQVITVFARTKTKLAGPLTASGSPLPGTLGGFTVQLEQTFSNGPVAVPILSARPIDNYTAISVQIPFELVANVEGSRQPENVASLRVVDNGESGEATPLRPVSAQIHILNSCDTPLNPAGGPCLPLVRHADGTAVGAAKPAVAGETITLLAYGLGLADSRVASGTTATSPAAVAGVTIDFRYGTNATVARPGASAASATAELAEGMVGVYRVSFPAPAAPAGTPACSAITSNASVTIGRAASFDGVGLCLFVENPGDGVQEVPPRGRR